jgi:hypothetical protein
VGGWGLRLYLGRMLCDVLSSSLTSSHPPLSSTHSLPSPFLSSLTLLLLLSSLLPLPYRSQLYSNKLTGVIPSELAKLTGLTSL